jgi:hypothetical protein
MPIQTAADSISNSAGSPYGFKNRIINGAMVIDQRNAGASGTASEYNIDRWAYYGSQSSKGTWQQNAGSVTPPPGFTNYLGFTSSSSYSTVTNDLFEFYQPIEGYSLADLGFGTSDAKQFTLSFWVRSSLTGTFGAGLTNAANTRNYPFTYTIISANTWEYKTLTFTADTTGTWNKTNDRGLTLLFSLGIGSGTYVGTAGAWNGTTSAIVPSGTVSVVGTSGATFYITGVQLEKGSQATSFDWRPYTTELQLCQRYFEKTYLQSEVPGANYDARDSASRNYSFGDSSVQSQPFVWNFKVSKRGAPTVNIYNPFNGTANQYRVLETGTNMSAQVIKNLSTETCTVASAGAGLSSNYRFDVHITAASEL